MRAFLYALLLPAWALLAGCLSQPTPDDWLEVGFRTPEQSFRTFQTAMRADLPELEYRCLGAGLKRRVGEEFQGFSFLAYLEFRRELFAAQPWLKLAATAEVRSVDETSPGHVRIVAEVETWLRNESFVIELAREDYWELWVDGQRIDDDLASWRQIAREEDGHLVVRVPLPSGMAAREIGELRAGGEWKIDSFPLRLDADKAP